MSFIIYRSSAGTGKTFTLVRTFLSLALSSNKEDAFKHILAITFTNKATAELKERILTTLRNMADVDQELLPLAQEVQKDTGITRVDLAKRAHDIHESILAQYDNLSVMTIDAFVHRLVRPFSRELGLSAGFEIELEDHLIISEAVDRLFEEAGSNILLTEYLYQYMIERLDDEKGWNVKEIVKEFALQISKESGAEALSEISEIDLSVYQKCITRLRNRIGDLEKEIDSIAKNLSKSADGAGLSSDCFQEKSRGCFVLPKNVMNDGFSVIKRAYFMPLLNGGDTVHKNCPKNLVVAARAHGEALISFAKLIFSYSNDYIKAQSILPDLYSQALLGTIAKHIHKIKEERNIVLLSDLHRRVSQITADTDATFVYEMTGLRYQHILIDEFQDTSVLQWQNLRPLVINCLSEKKAALVVGDAKQAIYRWRNGNVKQFIDLNTDNTAPLIVKTAVEIPLDVNRRSLPELIAFTNTFFKNIVIELNVSLINGIYKDSEAKTHRKGTGYVEWYFPKKEDIKNHKEAQIQYVLNTVKELVKEGFSLEDIAILCRDGKAIQLIADSLQTNTQIPVQSDEALSLWKSIHVQTIYFLLMFNLYPHEDSFQKQALYRLAGIAGKSNDLPQMLAQKFDASGQTLTTCLKQLGFDMPAAQKGSFNLHLHIMEWMDTLKFDVYFDSWLLEFESFVLDFQRKNGHSLEKFLDYFDQRREKLAVPATVEGGIKLLTIHKAKGLQFKIVIFPFADWENSKHHESIWISPGAIVPELPKVLVPMNKKMIDTDYAPWYKKNEEEKMADSINLLYVAFTRAEERLYVSAVQTVGTAKIYTNVLNNMRFNDGGNCIIYTGQKQLPIMNGMEQNTMELTEMPLVVSPALPNYDELAGMQNTGKNFSDPRKYGELIHDVLAIMPRLESVEKAIQKVSVQYELELSVKNKIKQTLKGMAKKSNLRELFELEGEVFMERAISDGNGGILRPDRYVITEDTVHIIDFKTGESSKTHRMQVNSYADVFIKMGYKSVKKYLLYTDTLTLVKWNN